MKNKYKAKKLVPKSNIENPENRVVLPNLNLKSIESELRIKISFKLNIVSLNLII
jgi:hypothetical protein